MKTSEISLHGASPEAIAEAAATALFSDPARASELSVKDISGNSGARTYLCRNDDTPVCIVKVQSGGGIMDSPEYLRGSVQPLRLCERRAGALIIMKGQIFMSGVGWRLRDERLLSLQPGTCTRAENRSIASQPFCLPPRHEPLKQQWPETLTWVNFSGRIFLCAVLVLPWSGIDTGMLLLGSVTNPETAKRLLDLEVESGVYEKVMLHEAPAGLKAGQPCPRS